MLPIRSVAGVCVGTFKQWSGPACEVVGVAFHRRKRSQVIPDVHGAMKDSLQFQRTQCLDERPQGFIVFRCQEISIQMLRPRHKPNAGLGHDTEVGLGEERCERRPDAISKRVFALGCRIMREACSQNSTVRDHDLKGAGRLHMIHVRSMAKAPIEQVSHDAGLRPCSRTIDHER